MPRHIVRQGPPERDLFGFGFSDNVIFRKQYYVRALLQDGATQLELHTGKEFREGKSGKPMKSADGGWTFEVSGTGFKATMRIALTPVE